MTLTRGFASFAALLAVTASVFGQDSAAPVTPPLVITTPETAEKVVAVVGDAEITETQVANTMRAAFQGRPVPPEAMAQVRGMVIDRMVEDLLVKQFVAGKKIVAEAKEVDAMIDKIKQQVADAGVDFTDVLQTQGLTAESLRERIASEMAFEKYAKSAVTEAKMKEYFAAHKKEFDGTQVRASHILLKYDPDSSDADKKAAQDKIAALKQEIAGGADFAELAKANSECPSSARGGDLDFFPRHNAMVEPFAVAAFSMKVGDVSEPIETQFGIHLLKVTDVKAGEQTFEDAQQAVADLLMGEVRQEAVEAQRKVTKVEIKK